MCRSNRRVLLVPHTLFEDEQLAAGLWIVTAIGMLYWPRA
jgi:hypothetical protein